MKKSIQFFVVLLSAIQVFAFTPHINKGKLTELTLEQAVKELQLSQKELQDINKEFYGVLEFNSNFPPVQEADFDSEVHIFKQTFKETNEIIYRVISRTKETAPFDRTGIFQKGYYTNGHGKPNLIFADFYDTEAETFGQSVTSVRLNYNFMPVIKKNKIAGIMIYGIERFDKENSIMEYTGSTQNLYHKAAVYWSDDFSTANLRNEYSNDPDIHIECSKPLIDEKDTFKYTIQNAFDKNPATSYVEDTDDDLFSIRFVFAKELFFQNYSWVIGKSLSINNISVINGYAANENLYFSNNRIKELIISSYNLENKKKSDNFLKELSKIYTGILKDNNLSFSTIQIPKEKIYSVTFSCTQLYKGKKYNDTCLAEFDLYNKNVGWFFGGVE
nr:hypothetical protein [Treponema socranskii]